ncbi:MAG: hypothetical protein SPI30_07215 [Prevotella sp.]|nr:hypothetical protein [Prevotella sp.]
MKTKVLIAAASMAVCINVAYSQTEQYVEIVSTKSTGDWRLSLDVVNVEDRDLVWVDLNHNEVKDDDESIGMWEWMSYSRPRNSERLKIYGPIRKLSCSFNDIKEIHLEKNSTIQELECTYSKDLTGLDLSVNKSLKKVNVYGCKLSSIKLPTSDAELEFLDINDNELMALDVSGCPKLATIHCFLNKLSAPAMQNLVNGLVDRSEMDNAGQMFVLKTIGKQEENEILKSTVLMAKKKNWKVKYFSGQTDYEGVDHSLYVTTLPKATLSTSLKEGAEWILVLGAETEASNRVWIDFNGNDLYDYGEEQAVFNEEVRFSVTNRVINIYGDLTKLICKGLSLTAIDVAGMTNLQVLDCSNNSIGELKLNANTRLTDLLAYKNQLNDIDLSKNALLSNISLNNNKLQHISLAENKKLTVLFVSDNELEELNVSACTNLASLAFNNNKIKNINLSENSVIETLYCSGNQLSKLDLSLLTKLSLVSCEQNSISSMTLPNSSKLMFVYCYGNQLKGGAMTELCKKLPMRETDNKGSLIIVDTKNEKEGNECLSTDVEIANKANWIVYDYRGKENGGYNVYDGIVTGIESLINTEDVLNTSYFNLQGIESSEPFKGVNIVITKCKDGSVVKTKSIF